MTATRIQKTGAHRRARWSAGTPARQRAHRARPRAGTACVPGLRGVTTETTWRTTGAVLTVQSSMAGNAPIRNASSRSARSVVATAFNH